jgi:hypothetical protein
MTDRRSEEPGSGGGRSRPIPHDLPDQQSGAPGADERWEARPVPDDDTEDVPDTDQAGTGRRGAPHRPGLDPGRPVPDEPSD